MKNSFQLITLKLLLLCVLFTSLINATYAQVLAKNPFCDGSPPEECLKGYITEADVVFEGTVLESNRFQDAEGNWKLRTVYQVDKLFKGVLKPGTVTEIVDEKKSTEHWVERHYEYTHEKLEYATLAPKKIGEKSIVLDMVTNRLKEDDNPEITTLNHSLNLSYTLGYPHLYFPTGKEHYVIYLQTKTGDLAFEMADELYSFIRATTGESFVDFTQVKVVKPTFEEWRKKKQSQKQKKGVGSSGSVERTSVDEPVITSFTEELPGGVGSILAITGTGFGNTPPDPNDPDHINIWFNTGYYLDWLGTPITIKLDNYDMEQMLWTDEEIQVPLPSQVNTLMSSTPTPFWFPAVLMSSQLALATPDGGTPWTSTKIHIQYCIENEIERTPDNLTVLAKRRKKITTDSNDGVFYFLVSEDVYNDCNLMNQINRALKDWKCVTGIDWRVKQKTTTGGGNDGSSVFYFGGGCCAGADEEFGGTCFGEYEIVENDIHICPGINSNPGCSNIYSTILHELGHIIGMMHTLPGEDGVKDLMHLPPFSPHADNITADDESGGIDNATFSMSVECNEAIDFTAFGDYSMKDNDGDLGLEPNCTATSGSDPIIDKSPDLWNCNDPGCTVHEEPIEGTANRMYGRITNISDKCSAFGGKVHFYWTIGSTGQMWPNDWIQHYWDGCLIGDEAGAVDIGVLAPLEEKIVSVDWTPPLLDDLITCDVPRYPWDEAGGWYQVCLLARIESDKDYNFLETNAVTVGVNIRNSNNIVTRNTKILDGPGIVFPPTVNNPATYVGDVSWMIFGNNNSEQKNLDLVLGTFSEDAGIDFQFIEILVSNELRAEILEESNSGLTEVSPNIFRLTGTGECIIPNVLMDGMERQLIGFRIAVEETDTIGYQSLNAGRSFYVTHRSSSETETINETSASIFTFPDFPTSFHGRENGFIRKIQEVYEPNEIYIYNRLGQIVSVFDPNITEPTQIRLQLENGIYFFVYKFDGKMIKSEKVVIMRR